MLDGRVSAIEIFAPAKLNLFLAITGRRLDGFHELVSLATTLAFGDTLWAESMVGLEVAGSFTLACDDPAVPLGENNLVLKAAHAFAEATGWNGGAKFFLQKRVPMGAGLGGGSSNAVAALRALEAISGVALGGEKLTGIAAGLGSDCPLFLNDGPMLIRGRGERIASLATTASARLRGRRVLVFKPAFGIATAWAYARMASAAPGSYLALAEAEAKIAGWCADGALPVEALLFNNMERVAFEKFVALPALVGLLRKKFGLASQMSGSGSACFALLAEDAPVAAITEVVREAWGPTCFVTETRIA